MKIGALIAILVAAAVVSASLPAATFARQGEQDRALEMRRQSDLIPYGVIANRAQQMFGGRVVGQRMYQMGKRVVYELRLLKADGKVMIVVMDAKTGQVIRTSGG